MSLSKPAPLLPKRKRRSKNMQITELTDLAEQGLAGKGPLAGDHRTLALIAIAERLDTIVYDMEIVAEAAQVYHRIHS